MHFQILHFPMYLVNINSYDKFWFKIIAILNKSFLYVCHCYKFLLAFIKTGIDFIRNSKLCWIFLLKLIFYDTYEKYRKQSDQ